MFAVFNIERDPLLMQTVLNGLSSWVQDVGGFAAVGLLFWAIAWMLAPRRFGPGRLFLFSASAEDDRTRLPPKWAAFAFTVALIGAGIGYGILAADRVPRWIASALESDETDDQPKAVSPGQPPRDPATTVPQQPKSKEKPIEPDAEWFVVTHTIAAACAVLAVSMPFLINLVQLRWRRIWGMAILSYKEAVRGRILYVFSIFIVLFLFLGWFTTSKREEQLLTYVNIVFFWMTLLLLISAGLISAFSIPKDIRNQTIHTVVTKPVERFEIIVGRFLGFALLMTLVLVVLTTLSLLYLLREINPDSAEESLKARAPLYGRDTYLRINDEYTDRESVQELPRNANNPGGEWDYHTYISGPSSHLPKTQKQYAVWIFDKLPSSLADRDAVRCEFNFDIYRTTKGKDEGLGVKVSLIFETHNYLRNKSQKLHSAYVQERGEIGAGFRIIPEKDNELSQKYGYFEVNGLEIEDFHTISVDVPAGLIRNALEYNAEHAAGQPLLGVRVSCDSETQLVGMARYSLYFRLDDATQPRNVLAFALNFYKASFGLGMRLILIVGLCVALSTELGGIISFLVAVLIFIGGICREFILDVSTKKNLGGGPFESFLRVMRKENQVTPLEESTINKVAFISDEIYRWVFGRVVKLLPDVDRYSFTTKVANGFNIGVFNEDLLPSFLMLLGYMFPWFLVGYYLLRTREIAGSH